MRDVLGFQPLPLPKPMFPFNPAMGASGCSGALRYASGMTITADPLVKPSRGVMLGTFLFGYGFFRIIIDYFREYRTELLGLPPGQEFNIAMSIGGIILIMWAVKKNYPRVKPLADDALLSGLNIDIRKATRTKRNVLRALLLIPVIIPSDWTQDVYQRYSNRHAGMITSDWYPAINRNDEKGP